LHNERWKLKFFYKEDERLKPNSIKLLLNWPLNLKELNGFIGNIYEEGTLTFAWDLEAYRDQLQPRPDYQTYTIFVFGPVSSGQKEFLRKLMFRVEYSKSAPPVVSDVEGIEKIITGIKPLVSDAQGGIRMLEMWEIPPSKHQAMSIRPFMVNAHVILYVIDLNASSSLELVQITYSAHQQTMLLYCSKVIVIIKSIDAAEQTVSEEHEAVLWAKRSGCIWFLMALQHEHEVLRISRALDTLLRRENVATTSLVALDEEHSHS
jgi:hypothetical protein